jgi:hypothetical protein
MSGKLKSKTRGGNFARKSLGNVNQSYFTLADVLGLPAFLGGRPFHRTAHHQRSCGEFAGETVQADRWNAALPSSC